LAEKNAGFVTEKAGNGRISKGSLNGGNVRCAEEMEVIAASTTAEQGIRLS